MSRYARASAALILVVLAAVVSATSRTRAQNAAAPQPQLLLITEIQLKPETAPEWTQLQKDEQIPAQKKGGLPWRDTWGSAVAGDPYLRATVVPVSSIAQFDNPPPAVKALGQEGAAALNAKNRRLIASSHAYIVRSRPDLGFGTRPASLKLGILTTVTVQNGRNAEFESFLKTDVVPALKKANVSYYVVTQTVYGGDSNQYRSVIAINDFAELAKGHPLERALGADGMAKLLQKTASFVARVERTIVRHIDDLSFGPTSPTSN